MDLTGALVLVKGSGLGCNRFVLVNISVPLINDIMV